MERMRLWNLNIWVYRNWKLKIDTNHENDNDDGDVEDGVSCYNNRSAPSVNKENDKQATASTPIK